MAGKRARSGPPGNGNAVQHGVYTLVRLQKEGALDGRSTLAKWRKMRVAEYVSSLGGEEEVSTQELASVKDLVDCEMLVARAKDELSGIKRLYRKGKAHPLLDVVFKGIATCLQIRGAIGYRRRAKNISDLAQALQAQAGKEDETDVHALAVAPDMVHQRGSNGGHDGGEEEGEQKERDE